MQINIQNKIYQLKEIASNLHQVEDKVVQIQDTIHKDRKFLMNFLDEITQLTNKTPQIQNKSQTNSQDINQKLDKNLNQQKDLGQRQPGVIRISGANQNIGMSSEKTKGLIIKSKKIHKPPTLQISQVEQQSQENIIIDLDDDLYNSKTSEKLHQKIDQNYTQNNAKNINYFSNLEQLKKKRRVDINDKNAMKCTVCSKVMKISSMKTHLENIHKGRGLDQFYEIKNLL